MSVISKYLFKKFVRTCFEKDCEINNLKVSPIILTFGMANVEDYIDEVQPDEIKVPEEDDLEVKRESLAILASLGSTAVVLHRSKAAL